MTFIGLTIIDELVLGVYMLFVLPWYDKPGRLGVKSKLHTFSSSSFLDWALNIKFFSLWTLFIRSKHNLQMFGVFPFIKLQNDI